VIIGGSPVILAIPAPRPAPHTDLVALSRAMDHAASAAYVAREGGQDTARRLIVLARIPAARAFPAGSREAEALAVILAAIGGAS
jgi:hypothetical protein